MPPRRRVTATKSRPRPKRGQSPPNSGNGSPATRRRRDFLTRKWATLATAARHVGFDNSKILRKPLVGQAFVRVVGDRWYVRPVEFVEWFEQQRPTARGAR